MSNKRNHAKKKIAGDANLKVTSFQELAQEWDETFVIDSMREYPTGKEMLMNKMVEGGFKPGEMQILASSGRFQPRPYQKSMIMALAAKGYFAAGDTMKHYDPEAFKRSPPALSLVGALIKRLFRPERAIAKTISADEMSLLASFSIMEGMRARGLAKDMTRVVDQLILTESHDVGTKPRNLSPYTGA